MTSAIPAAAFRSPYQPEEFNAAAHPVQSLSMPKTLEVLLKTFLNTRSPLINEIRKELNGCHGPSKTWKAVCIKLSQQPAFKGLISVGWVKDIERGGNSSDAPQRFLNNFEGLPDSTVGNFVKALVDAESCFFKISRDILNAAGASEWDPAKYKFAQLPLSSDSEKIALDHYFKEFIQHDLELYFKIIKTIAEKDNPEKSWRGIIHNLARQDGFKAKFKPDADAWCSKTEEHYQTSFDRSEAILNGFWGMGRSTVRALVTALMATDPSYESLCREICDKAGASDFLDQLRAKPAAAGNLADDAIPSQTALAPLLNALATERQRSLVLQNEMEALKHKGAEPDPDAWECKICMDRKIEVITYPCRHIQMCEECVKVQKFCPFCNGNFNRWERVNVV